MGADGSVMDWRSAVRTATLQQFSANGAELAPHRIRLHAIGLQQTPTVDEILRMGRTEGIRTEGRMRPDLLTDDGLSQDDRLFILLRLELNLELRADLLDGLVIELRAISLLDHGNRRLLATDFGSKPALRQTRGNAGLSHLTANLWAQIYHGAYYGLS